MTAVRPFLRVEAVSKEFKSGLAVDALSFEVEPGEIFALLGPNGAGKTTTVRMLIGILKPDSGRIAFDSASGGPSRKHLGYLPEDRGLHPDTSVARTLEYFGVLHGMRRKEAAAAGREGLRLFGLADRQSERIDALSKGNQQKVQFLAAVMHRPSFVALDEPFTGLDPINQQIFADQIRALRDCGGTVLLSAHQMDLVESLADRLLLMDRGRCVLHGSLAEIRKSTGSGTRLELGIETGTETSFLDAMPEIQRVTHQTPDRVTLTLADSAHVGTVLHAVTARLSITSVHSQPESLREIFVRTVGRPLEEETNEEMSP